MLRSLLNKPWYVVKILVLGSLFNFAYAVSSSDVDQDLSGLIRQINKVNDDLNTEQKQQKSLSKAINDSNAAIDKSQELLNRLKAQRNLDMKQLDEIEAVFPQLAQATSTAQNNVKFAIDRIYKQLRLLQSDKNTSIVNGNDNLQYERKKKYLVKLLELEQQKYVDLQAKLDKLNILNDKINNELDTLDRQLGITSKRKSKLQQEKETKLQQAAILQAQISKEKVQLANLQQQQKQLNKLLQNLHTMEVAEKVQANKESSKQLALGKADNRYEDNSPFLSRKLSKPVEGGAALVKFGEIRGGVPNNGILFKANNAAIHAISNGRVLFAGLLPGFGQMIVIDNGDSYTSIYGGILPKVNKNQKVAANQVIASSGGAANQPMGGVYFELRHLGKPVNPSKLQ